MVSWAYTYFIFACINYKWTSKSHIKCNHRINLDTKGVHVYEGPSKLYENATIKTDWIESFCMKLNLSFICFQELYEISCMWCIKCLKRLETSELNGIVYLMKCNPTEPSCRRIPGLCLYLKYQCTFQCWWEREN